MRSRAGRRDDATAGVQAGRNELQRPQFRLVTVKHESGAVFLAMGYAMATGRMALVLTTAGPGITNLLTGLASAHYENVPLLVISGEVSTTAFGRGALQDGSSAELDAVALVRRCTRFAAQITRGESATALVRKAIHASLSGRRGPSFLSLPLDVSAACQGESPPIRGNAHTAFEVDAAGCARAMRLLLDARRPLVLAGSGARGAASRAALRRLAEASGAPVAVTPKAKSVFPEDHPLYLGVFGFGGHESVIQYLRDGVDVLLVCGSGLDDFSTNAWSPLLAARTAFIQIDIDTAQLGNSYPIDLGLLGPVERVIEQMFREMSGAPRPTRPCPGLVTQHSPRSPSGALTTAEVVLMMNDLCPPDSVFTADMGEHLSIALHYLRVREQGEFLTCLGFGSMGSGLCAAIGFQLGAPSRRVHAITGDGCFLMYGGELATAVQHRLPLTVVVINIITGLQGSALNAPGSVLATAKHYVGDGGTTGGVDQGNTQLSEADLRAIHLPPFQAAVQRGVGAVVIASVAISNTGGWQTWGSVTTNLTSSVTGVHTVVITFTGSGGEFVNLNWFRFGH